MIFGKHINRYYLKYGPMLLLGLAALIMVDNFQLTIPHFYQMVINGTSTGFVTVDGAQVAFTLDFLLDEICMPMVGIIVCLVFYIILSSKSKKQHKKSRPSPKR